ncbi:MAG: radical SAM protein, partial [bacterium]
MTDRQFGMSGPRRMELAPSTRDAVRENSDGACRETFVISAGTDVFGFRSLSDLMTAVSGLALESDRHPVIFEGIPPCLFNGNPARYEYLFGFSPLPCATTGPACGSCRFSRQCPGFGPELAEFMSKEGFPPPHRDIPAEIIIELESSCQRHCNFCFNTAGNSRRLSDTEIISAIDQTAAMGSERVRFSGGEPLLRENILGLADHAREAGLAVWLNTNGYALTDKKTAAGLVRRFENILLSIHGWDGPSEAGMTGLEDSFERMIRAAGLLKEAGVSTLRFGTVLTARNAGNIDRILDVIQDFCPHHWEIYRPVLTEFNNVPPPTADIILKTAEKLVQYAENGRVPAFIANPVPFCAGDPARISRISLGAVWGEGNQRFLVDS